MAKQGIKVEQVLEFLNSKESAGILAEYVDKKLKSMDLPTSVNELDDEDLLDEMLDMGICFFCDFGEPDYRDDVYVVGYNAKTRELIVRGNDGIDGVCPVSIDELEFNSLLELAKVLAY